MVPKLLEVALGTVVVFSVLFDLFQSIVLPRPTPGTFRLTDFLIRASWKLFRTIGLRASATEKREGILGAYAPLAILMLLFTWVVGLIAGYGLIDYGLRDQLGPRAPDLGSTLYFSATSLLTIGFGDIVPVGGPARVIAMLEAGTGLGVVALTISLLFSLYGSFQKREIQVITLDASAGSPPSAIGLLETCSWMAMPQHLDQVFGEWKLWSAEVLDSHLAYPILNYFRSSHDNESWVSALGAVLDAATLVLTTLDGVPKGPAKLMFHVGTHLVEDLTHLFKFEHGGEVGIERSEFDDACLRLEAAGYRLRNQETAWEDFSQRRAVYASSLNALAQYWAIPPAQWVGDRSYIPHAGRAHA